MLIRLAALLLLLNLSATAETYTPKFINLSTGARLEYTETGDRSGTPVILLHGITDSWHSYELVLPHLPESLHVFALSARGHGDSSRPQSGYTPQDFSADVLAFMNARKLKKAVIVGHSMGSYHAQRFAADHPGRVVALVLVGSSPNIAASPAARELWEAVAKFDDGPVDPKFAEDFQQSTIAQPVPPASFRRWVSESLKVPGRVWKAALTGLMESDHTPLLPRISAPTLIIAGEKDTVFTTQDAERMRAGIPGARLLVYEDTGHAIHWELPQRFARDLTQFVQTQTVERN
jgi:non-heme chloroperoxidase